MESQDTGSVDLQATVALIADCRDELIEAAKGLTQAAQSLTLEPLQREVQALRHLLTPATRTRRPPWLVQGAALVGAGVLGALAMWLVTPAASQEAHLMRALDGVLVTRTHQLQA